MIITDRCDRFSYELKRENREREKMGRIARVVAMGVEGTSIRQVRFASAKFSNSLGVTILVCSISKPPDYVEPLYCIAFTPKFGHNQTWIANL